MPTLAGVRTTYSHELGGELLFDVCSVLTREGFGTPAIWQETEGSCATFAQRAIVTAIGKETWELLERHCEYHLTVSDVGLRDGEDALIGAGLVAITIECSGYAHLRIGPVIAALEEESKGFGAAFHWSLLHALYRVMRIYDHQDAEQSEGMAQENVDPDDPEKTELPKVDRALPECVRLLWDRGHEAATRESQRLLSGARTGPYRSWIERLRAITRLSRLPFRPDRDFVEQGGYDSEPLPSLLVTFEENDAIMAYFDEEANYMMQGYSEPTLAFAFSPKDEADVRRARQVVSRFIAVNRELFLLVEELEAWEKANAGTYLHRGEPSLHAA